MKIASWWNTLALTNWWMNYLHLRKFVKIDIYKIVDDWCDCFDDVDYRYYFAFRRIFIITCVRVCVRMFIFFFFFFLFLIAFSNFFFSHYYFNAITHLSLRERSRFFDKFIIFCFILRFKIFAINWCCVFRILNFSIAFFALRKYF